MKRFEATMVRRATGFVAAGLMGSALLFGATDAYSDRAPAFTAKAEAGCQAAIGKGATGLLAAHLKGWAKCLGDERKGKGACVAPDTTKADAKFRAAVAKKCDPIAATFDDIIGLGASVSGAADSIVDETTTGVAALIDGLLSGNDSAIGDKALSKCFGAIAKGAALAGSALAKIDGKCLDADDKQQVKDPAALPKCDEAKRLAGRAKAVAKAAGLIAKSCDSAQIQTASSMTFDEAETAVASVVDGVQTHVCSWYPQARNHKLCFDFDEVSKIEVHMLFDGGNLGWTGIFHNVPSGEALPYEMELENCNVADDERICDVVQDDPGAILTIRQSIEGGVASCAVYRSLGSRTGTIRFNSNFDVLAFDLMEPFDIEIFNGDTLMSPCPFCTGEDVGDAGVCVGGANDGEACVSGRERPGFPHTSPDCVPDADDRFDVITVAQGGSVFSSDPQMFAATEACVDGGNDCHCPGQKKANRCEDGFCPSESSQCPLTDQPDSALTPCMSSPYTRDAGDAIGDEITMSQAVCIDGGNPINLVVLGLPGPMSTTQRVRVRPTE